MNAVRTRLNIAPRDRYAAVHFRECFIDELARAAWRDPVQYRREMLPADSHLRAVLDRAARASGWSRALPGSAARGVALTASRGAVAAHVAEVRMDEQGECHLARMVIVLDGEPKACAALARAGMAPAVANAMVALRARVAVLADEADEADEADLGDRSDEVTA